MEKVNFLFEKVITIWQQVQKFSSAQLSDINQKKKTFSRD